MNALVERDVTRALVDGRQMPVARWFRDGDEWMVLVPQAFGQRTANGPCGPLDCEASEGDRVLVRSKGGREQIVRLGRPRGGYGLGGKLFQAATDAANERRAA